MNARSTRIAADGCADYRGSAAIRVGISGHPRWDQRSSAFSIRGHPRSGQATVEYAILIGIVTAAIVGMQVYAKRGIQAGLKLAADQVGDQLQGILYESGDRQDRVIREGTLLERESAVASVVDRRVNARTRVGGSRTATTLGDTTTTNGAVTDHRLPAAEFPFCREAVVGEGRVNVSVCAAVATAVQ